MRKLPLVYRPDVDGLRAVAIAAVVAFHAFPGAVRGGFTGVDLFFVISGYLISRIIWSRLQDGRFTLAWFYGRRALRLFPALALLLAATLVAGRWLLLPDAYETLGKDVASAAAFVSNLVLWHDAGYFSENAALRPLTHLWSLAVEEQFYLVLPLLLLVTRRSWRVTGGVLALLLGCSFAWSVHATRTDAPQAFYLLPSRFWELLVGCLLAYAQLSGRACLRPRLADAASIAGVALLPVAFLGPTSSSLFPGWWALAPTVAAVLIIGAGPSAFVNRRLLAPSPVVLLGRISYPLYLWHFPLLVLARIQWGPSLSTALRLAVVVISVVLAYGTYRLVELPVRALVAGRSWRPAVVAAPLAAVGCAGIAVFLAAGLPGRLPVKIQRLTTVPFDHHTAYRESRCFLQPWQGLRAFKPDCVDSGKGKLLLLWGDSHAAHLYPGLRTVARERRFRIAQLTASACPPLLGYRSSDRPKCHAINAGVLRRAAELRPDSVVLSGRWEEYGDVAALGRTVTELRRLGIDQIVVVGPSPSWELGLPQTLYNEVKRQNLARFPTRMKQQPSSEQARVDRELRDLSRRLNVTYVAPLAVLCNAEGCLARVADAVDQLTFWDPSHFTTAGSTYFVDAVAPQLLRGVY
ncbi:MAG TPA: acyltransferase family protein [Gaiellaceae bacterium]|nr:acyltransferase family protein [Gaiellaceae bacterium]